MERGVPPLGRDVTLFSFRHAIGGLLLDDGDGGFSVGRTSGFIDYFDQVHAAMALLARRYPDRTVHIKPKWMGGWAERVEDAIRRLTGLSPAEIPNLRIGADIGAQELIRRSGVVVGINSTALIEARVLGRPVIVPVFAEAAERYRGNVYFQKFFGSDFHVAETLDALVAAVAELLSGATVSLASDDLVTEFLGFRDGRSTARVVDLLKSQARRAVATGDWPTSRDGVSS